MGGHWFSPPGIIRKKRDGRSLTRDEMEAWIRGVVDGTFADYQSAALLMAIYHQGMGADETAWLTEAMMRSGEVIKLPKIALPKVDKHSTGGVGDKVSLILAPLAAAAGLCVPMISGRGLGHTGGTLDKLESIPGFRVGLSAGEFRKQLGEIGVALAGQSDSLVPADRKLYALRDVTATVESIPLISASIMSKKLAEGIDSLVLDVKYGRGAFMKTIQDARELARSMVEIGRAMNRPTVALLTSMDQPLGRSVGNAVEVIEAIECLKGNGPADLMEVTFALTAQMLLLGGLAPDGPSARAKLESVLSSGAALEKFRAIIAAQGGNPAVIDDYKLLPTARQVVEIRAPRSGFITDVDPMAIATAAMNLGAGRETMNDTIDPAVGITDIVQTGERISKGDVLCRLHVNDKNGLLEIRACAGSAFAVCDNRLQPDSISIERMA